MISVEDNIAQVEGTPKELCTELTHLLVVMINCFQKDFNLSQEQSISVINECAKIAYMDDESRAEYLLNIGEEE